MSMYFSASESRQFAFFRIPKEMMLNPRFQDMSTDAKLLYGLMLDRMELSERNQWLDAQGHVYIYFTIEEIMQLMNCAHQKVGKMFKELESHDLIERKRQGLGNPARIYVKNFISQESSVQTAENHPSGPMNIIPTDCRKSSGNNTEKNKTEKNKTETYPSFSEGRDAIDSKENLEEFFRSQLGLEALLHDNPLEQTTILEILELLVDTCTSKKESIRVGGEDRPTKVVRSRLMKLTMSHIQYVMECLQDNNTEIRDMRQYLLTTLYNAPTTMTSYYRAKVNSFFG